MIDDLDLGYVMGFFDAEGSVTYRVSNGRRNPRYYLHVCAYQLQEHKEPLELLQREFGGHITTRKGNNKGTRKMCTWYIGGLSAIAFLQRVLPRLRVKREIANHVLLFEKYRELTKDERKSRRRSSDEYLEICARVKRMSSFMNTGKIKPQGVAPDLSEALAEGGQSWQLM